MFNDLLTMHLWVSKDDCGSVKQPLRIALICQDKWLNHELSVSEVLNAVVPVLNAAGSILTDVLMPHKQKQRGTDQLK